MSNHPYKVFLVEDEAITREGIRERVDWTAAGFTFCGEAPDGEAALPLLQTSRPDVLITDIKMPFMNGLELCKIMQESLPGLKTIILTGHDEFDYARQAIKLGVSEYLLKPIAGPDLQAVLARIASQLDQETAERERIARMQAQLDDSLALQREKFLLQLVMGGISSMEALERSLPLRVNLIARYYQIGICKAVLAESHAHSLHYRAYQQIDRLIQEIASRSSEVITFKKGIDETVLILTGDNMDRVSQESLSLKEALDAMAEKADGGDKPEWRLETRTSAVCSRLGEISQAYFACLRSFRESPPAAAAARSQAVTPPHWEPPRAQPATLLQLEPQAVEKFLTGGVRADFDSFFAGFIKPIPMGEPVPKLFLEYLFLDILLITANFISELGGQTEQVIPELRYCEQAANEMKTTDQLRDLASRILLAGLDFRDKVSGSPHAKIIARARAYIQTHFANPALSLAEVAGHVHLSPSHFSVVFSRETHTTFIEYVTLCRIQKAQELLRNTALKASEISARVGYDNPHYFSVVFKRITGQVPSEFRLATRS
jgi:two-component system, response regulator YesN